MSKNNGFDTAWTFPFFMSMAFSFLTSFEGQKFNPAGCLTGLALPMEIYAAAVISPIR